MWPERVQRLIVATIRLSLVAFLRVALLDVHNLNVGVHCGGAVSLLHSDVDESTLAPTFAPGVLYDPVRLVARVNQANYGHAVIDASRAVVFF